MELASYSKEYTGLVSMFGWLIGNVIYYMVPISYLANDTIKNMKKGRRIWLIRYDNSYIGYFSLTPFDNNNIGLFIKEKIEKIEVKTRLDNYPVKYLLFKYNFNYVKKVDIY